MGELVLTSRAGQVGICTLNQPEKRNPISREMRENLIRALENFRTDKEIRAVVLTGAGDCFCSGLDLDALRENLSLPPDRQLEDSRSIAEFFRYVQAYPKPTLAALNGPAVAGGFGLLLVCDLGVASRTAFLSFSEVKIGFTPAIVALYLARCAGAKLCRELLFTARKLTAAEALAAGLLNQVAESAAEVLPRALELAEQICRNSPAGVSATKDVLVRADAPSDAAMELSVAANARARATSDCKEGVSAFLEKRKPNWQ